MQKTLSPVSYWSHQLSNLLLTLSLSLIPSFMSFILNLLIYFCKWVFTTLVQSLQEVEKNVWKELEEGEGRRLWSNQNTTSFWCKSKKVTDSSKLTGSRKSTGSTMRQNLINLLFENFGVENMAAIWQKAQTAETTTIFGYYWSVFATWNWF